LTLLFLTLSPNSKNSPGQRYYPALACSSRDGTGKFRPAVGNQPVTAWPTYIAIDTAGGPRRIGGQNVKYDTDTKKNRLFAEFFCFWTAQKIRPNRAPHRCHWYPSRIEHAPKTTGKTGVADSRSRIDSLTPDGVVAIWGELSPEDRMDWIEMGRALPRDSNIGAWTQNTPETVGDDSL
jgi:hypothetical protein